MNFMFKSRSRTIFLPITKMFKPSIILLLLTPTSFAATLSFDWNIGFVTAAPDGVSRQVIGINGQWPLPVIEGTLGDTVTINITNSLGTQSTGLHFHGINQNGSPIMDGPSGVTQCPVPPGSFFTYTFKVGIFNETLRTWLTFT
jgi:iron transport multicopper oxidase